MPQMGVPDCCQHYIPAAFRKRETRSTPRDYDPARPAAVRSDFIAACRRPGTTPNFGPVFCTKKALCFQGTSLQLKCLMAVRQRGVGHTGSTSLPGGLRGSTLQKYRCRTGERSMLDQTMARTIYNKAIWWSAAGFILLGWLAGHGAWAGALPAPNATVAAYLTNGEESGGVGLPPQDGLLDSPGVGVGCAAAVGNGFLSVCGISANPAGPAVAVTVVGGEMNAESELFYYVQIAGPTNTIVPVIVEGNAYYWSFQLIPRQF